MRKTSTYARKRARIKDTLQYHIRRLSSLELLTARCTPYDSNSKMDVKSILIKVYMALESLTQKHLPSSETDDYDTIVISLGEAKVRYVEVGGTENNQALERIQNAETILEKALAQCRQTGHWVFSEDEIQSVQEAVVLYDEILRVSSPQQMADAAGTLLKWLRMQMRDKKEVA